MTYSWGWWTMPYVDYTYAIYTQYMRNTYAIHTRYIRNIYAIHTQYIRNTYAIHTQYMQYICNICNTYAIHTQYIRNIYAIYGNRSTASVGCKKTQHFQQPEPLLRPLKTPPPPLKTPTPLRAPNSQPTYPVQSTQVGATASTGSQHPPGGEGSPWPCSTTGAGTKRCWAAPARQPAAAGGMIACIPVEMQACVVNVTSQIIWAKQRHQ